MNKVFKRVLSQLLAITFSTQLISQYSYPIIPHVRNYAKGIEVQEEVTEAELAEPSVDNSESEEVTVDETAETTTEVETTTESEIVYEDWSVTSNVTLSEAKDVNNLTISAGTLNLNGNKLNVHGDVILKNDGKLSFNKGELYCNNFTMSSYSYMYMNNVNDYLNVSGDFKFNGGYFYTSHATAGTIVLNGDFTSNSSYFRPEKEHKVVFNGTEKQTISIGNNNTCFNILELSNTSKEGVVSATPVPANQSIISGDCVVNFGGAAIVGETLSEDIELEGDYCLAAGVLDLNGKTLTINGNLIQSGGEIVINGGVLDVKGDYRIQSRTEKEDGTYSYGYSTGYLTMTNEADTVKIGGSFVTDSSVNHSGKLTAGTMEIGGDFTQNSSKSSYNFIATGT
ncbi:MAG: hypothetical protein IKJ59_05365, partial [Clostridia bacterium]|nr:hypothetical protein [Clostridia bacterium]